MGNEGYWWVAAGAITFLIVAGVGFIAVKIVLLFTREWRRSRGDYPYLLDPVWPKLEADPLFDGGYYTG